MKKIVYDISFNDMIRDITKNNSWYQGEEFVDPNSKENKSVMRSEWYIDNNILIFIQDRDYVERWL